MWRIILGGIISQLPPATRQYQPQDRPAVKKLKGKAVALTKKKDEHEHAVVRFS
jgi:hypothetical protein